MLPLFEKLTVITVRRIGKGFQGGMKKWGFRGLRASHGVSVSHRKLGATGGHQVCNHVLNATSGLH